jgi:hypothetical protein
MREQLEDLFYQVRSRFYIITTEDYCNAISELSRLSTLLGFSCNEIVKNIIVRGE